MIFLFKKNKCFLSSVIFFIIFNRGGATMFMHLILSCLFLVNSSLFSMTSTQNRASAQRRTRGECGDQRSQKILPSKYPENFMEKVLTESPADFQSWAEQWINEGSLIKDSSFLILGEAGSGKTTLVNAFAQRLGLSVAPISGSYIKNAIKNSDLDIIKKIKKLVHQKKQKIILLLDDLHHLRELTYLYDPQEVIPNNHNLTVIQELMVVLQQSFEKNHILVMGVAHNIEDIPLALRGLLHRFVAEMPVSNVERLKQEGLTEYNNFGNSIETQNNASPSPQQSTQNTTQEVRQEAGDRVTNNNENTTFPVPQNNVENNREEGRRAIERTEPGVAAAHNASGDMETRYSQEFMNQIINLNPPKIAQIITALQSTQVPHDRKPKGLLLIGDPYTGASTLAKVVAQASEIRPIIISGKVVQRRADVDTYLNNLIEPLISIQPQRALIIDELHYLTDGYDIPTHENYQRAKMVSKLLERCLEANKPFFIGIIPHINYVPRGLKDLLCENIMILPAGNPINFLTTIVQKHLSYYSYELSEDYKKRFIQQLAYDRFDVDKIQRLIIEASQRALARNRNIVIREEDLKEAYAQFRESIMMDGPRLDELLINNIFREASEEINSLVRNLKTDFETARRVFLFVGKPGCGKSELAKAIACKLDLPYHVKHGSEFGTRYIHSREENIKLWIEPFLRDLTKRVLILDEFDLAYEQSNNDTVDRTPAGELWGKIEAIGKSQHLLFIGTLNSLDKVPQEIISRVKQAVIEFPSLDDMKKLERAFTYFVGNEYTVEGINSDWIKYTNLLKRGGQYSGAALGGISGAYSGVRAIKASSAACAKFTELMAAETVATAAAGTATTASAGITGAMKAAIGTAIKSGGALKAGASTVYTQISGTGAVFVGTLGAPMVVGMVGVGIGYGAYKFFKWWHCFQLSNLQGIAYRDLGDFIKKAKECAQTRLPGTQVLILKDFEKAWETLQLSEKKNAGWSLERVADLARVAGTARSIIR